MPKRGAQDKTGSPAPAGPFPAVPPPSRHGSLPHVLRRRASDAGGAEFLRFEGHSVSFAEAEARTNRLARSLEALGLEPRDRVGLMLPNGLAFPLLWLAVAKARGVVVPVNPGYGVHDLAHVLRDAGVRFLVAEEEARGRIRRAAGECPSLERVCPPSLDRAAPPGDPGAAWGPSGTGGQGAATPARGDPPADRRARAGDAAAPAKGSGDESRAAERAGRPAGEGVAPPSLEGVGPDRLVTVQYTSGTTGLPKGCQLTHGYWLRLAETIRACGGFTRDDVALTAQPFHYMDPVWNLALSLVAGIPLVILPRFSASTFWRSVRDAGATFFYCIGTMPIYLSKQPEDPEVERDHDVRLVLCSGIPERRHDDFERRWGCPWRETYGTTELGVVLMAPPGDDASTGTGSMGVPVPGREVRLAGADGDAPAPGEPGELLVRGPDVMRRYHRAPEATEAWGSGGWAHTGDLAVELERGGYRMVGRLTDMIRRGGENVSAAEVEGVLAEHPAVRAAACVAVPDEERGEEVKAFVQLRDGESAETVPPAALSAFAGERLVDFKVPRYWTYVEAFPLTPSQKIAKAELEEADGDPTAGAWDRVAGRWL